MKLYIKPVGAIGTNCYILADDNKACAIIDPGAQSERLIEFLESRDLTPQYILLTHGHYDHIGGVKALVKRFACKLAVGEQDAEQLTDPSKSLAVLRSMDEAVYIMTPDLLLQDGDIVTVGEMQFVAIDTPGHTRGGISYQCADMLFTGDTLFAGDVGRTDLYGGSYPALMKSVERLAALSGDYRVLPGHGPESRLSLERQHNPYMRKQLDEDFY